MGKASDLLFVALWIIGFPAATVFITYIICASIPTQQEIHERFEKVSQERIARCNAKNGTPVLNEFMYFESCVLNKRTP